MKITCWCRNPLLQQCTSNSAHVGRLPHGAQSFELAILRSHPKIYLSLTSSIAIVVPPSDILGVVDPASTENIGEQDRKKNTNGNDA